MVTVLVLCSRSLPPWMLEADDRECYPASTLLSRGTAGCRRFKASSPYLWHCQVGRLEPLKSPACLSSVVLSSRSLVHKKPMTESILGVFGPCSLPQALPGRRVEATEAACRPIHRFFSLLSVSALKQDIAAGWNRLEPAASKSLFPLSQASANDEAERNLAGQSNGPACA